MSNLITSKPWWDVANEEAEEEAGGVLNVVTKTNVLWRESVCLSDSLIATWFTVHSNMQRWMTDCPVRVYGFCNWTVCACAVHLVSEIQVRLYWCSKESAPSSAILSKTVNHCPDDLDALFLWDSIHTYVYTNTQTCTHSHIQLTWRITCPDCREWWTHLMPTHQTTRSQWNKS